MFHHQVMTRNPEKVTWSLGGAADGGEQVLDLGIHLGRIGYSLLHFATNGVADTTAQAMRAAAGAKTTRP